MEDEPVDEHALAAPLGERHEQLPVLVAVPSGNPPAVDHGLAAEQAGRLPEIRVQQDPGIPRGGLAYEVDVSEMVAVPERERVRRARGRARRPASASAPASARSSDAITKTYGVCAASNPARRAEATPPLGLRTSRMRPSAARRSSSAIVAGSREPSSTTMISTGSCLAYRVHRLADRRAVVVARHDDGDARCVPRQAGALGRGLLEPVRGPCQRTQVRVGARGSRDRRGGTPRCGRSCARRAAARPPAAAPSPRQRSCGG